MTKKNRTSRFEKVEVLDFKLCGFFVMLFAVGKAVFEGLSKKLTAEFGKGFDESNLRYMRLFYQTFKNCDTLRHELTWSHYRMLEVQTTIPWLKIPKFCGKFKISWQKANVFTYLFLSELMPRVFFLVFMA